MKNRKILAIFLSVAMFCSSLPAYAAADVPPSGGVSEQTNSQSASSNEGTEATQNNESSSQAEPDASSEEAVDNENNSQAESNASGEEAVNNENNSQAESNASSEEAVNNENNSQEKSNASSEETVNNEATSQAENNNINEQNAEESQINNKSVAQNVYDLCNGDIDVYYEHGVYYITQNNEQHADAQPPVISSAGETSNYVYVHTPLSLNSENEETADVIIRDLNISTDSDGLYINGRVNLKVENNCFIKTTSTTTVDKYRFNHGAAINVPGNSNLTISGTGSLYASSSGNGAAIGTAATYYNCTVKNEAIPCGNIEITENVKVYAENTGNGAAIGTAYTASSSNLGVLYGGSTQNITISDNADVTAISNGHSAAIGGGGTTGEQGGNCGAVLVQNNANVTAIANNELSAAIGSGPASYNDHSIASAGDFEGISILNNATVTAIGGFTGIGYSADCVFEADVRYLCDAGYLVMDDTATLNCYATTATEPAILSKYTSRSENQDLNLCIGDFSNYPIGEQTELALFNTDTGEYVRDICLPQNTVSFAVSVPDEGNYALLSGTDHLSTLSEESGIEKIVEDNEDKDFLMSSAKASTFETVSYRTYYPDDHTKLIYKSADLDLSQGSITISGTDTDGVICLEQNGKKTCVLSEQDNIVITQSSPETTGNNITIKGNVDGAQPIILENLDISCEHPIVVEKGADVNLIFHNNNSLTATNCQKSTDYPAIEVPGGATVTLSGDGSLNATANGYAAAIGTKGYYRDGKDHSDGNKSSGTVQIEDSLNVKAHSAYGAGIGGGAINGSSCEQHAFDNGTVIIKGSAVVEALGSTEGGYSAGIGGGGCYTSTCAAVGGNGGDVQILENAHVTAVCKGSLGAGIGGGGGCGKTADGFGGDGESFKADNSAVVVATGAKYGPGIGGGGAQQKTCCGTHPGNSGSCSVLGNSNVTAQNGGKVSNFGIGGHTGGWANYNGSYTEPQVDSTATFNA